MEEIGAQVAPPIFIHQTGFCEPISMARKRGLPPQPQLHQQQQLRGSQNPRDNSWNPKVWDWDSVRFVAKPSESGALSLGYTTSFQPELQRIRDEESNKPNPAITKTQNRIPGDEDDDENLRLKLGGGGSPSSTEGPLPLSRPNKRVRSGSPGGGNNIPMCQVDNCKEDLSHAKDYHRRHKVCEVHSKASKALVGKQIQRFCQQCSRFHPLTEFDEGKRSCRRRLAGHNRRRRKTQPEDVTSQLLLPGNHDNSGKADSDIINLLTFLARAQGNAQDRSSKCSSGPNNDQLIQILSKINSLPLPADFVAKLPVSGSLKKNVSEQVSSDNPNRLSENTSSPSTMDLLAVLSATLAAPTPNALAVPSQSSQASDTEKTRSACLDQGTCHNKQKGSVLELASVGGDRSSTSVEDSDCQVQETCTDMPFQLFGPSSERKYFSSDSSNPMDEQSPSSSPPVVQKLFPVQTSRGIVEPESMSTNGEVNVNIERSRTHGCMTPLELFGGSNRVANSPAFQRFPYQTGYTSSSGSDHSPSGLNSDAKDRTGRIIFKLFDKDPSHLPETLRQQIYNWLSHSPLDMESHIRPGCVVLSVYISMSSFSWERLEADLLQHVHSLVQHFDTDFWRNGRFLVQTDRQVVSHKDGKIRLCKPQRAQNSPELICVSPLALVGGQATSLLLRGRNLYNQGTKIHCTHMGGYMSREVSGPSCWETAYDEISLDRFTIYGAAPTLLGRCFLEVENGFGNSSFPVIIADATICEELRILESEIEDGANMHDAPSEDHSCEFGGPRSREEVLHFLNELGWIFQRKRISYMAEGPDYAISRFKFLFIFSVERNFSALVKTLLDILQEITFGREELSRESWEMLSEINLLNRAVKRRCRSMVDLLIHYSVPAGVGASRKYIFLPNHIGPSGVTPLHVAACTSGSYDIVDALTSDPQEIGLRCWNSLLDSNGLTPYAYASMRNNHSYNMLVAGKLAERIKGEVSLSIGNEGDRQRLTSDLDNKKPIAQFTQQRRSCSRCAVVATIYNRRIHGSQGLLQRPYIHSMLAIAAVCVCVCLLFRGAPDIGSVAPFKWENMGYGPM